MTEYNAFYGGCSDPECFCGGCWGAIEIHKTDGCRVWKMDFDADDYNEEEIKQKFLEALKKYPCDNVNLEEESIWDWIE